MPHFFFQYVRCAKMSASEIQSIELISVARTLKFLVRFNVAAKTSYITLKFLIDKKEYRLVLARLQLTLFHK